MDSSIRSTIIRTIDIAWRRRFLLAIPFLIMLPVSVACAVLLGGGYSARSLVMLQETVASNPLAHDTSEPNADRTAQMLKGLRALLASDYVLSPVVDESGGASLDAATRASRIKSLAMNVSVDLLGNDFLEFRLGGGTPKGLGATLQRTMTSLIGALVSPPGESAGIFALRALKEKLAAGDRQSAALDVRIAGLLPEGLAAAETQIAAWVRQKSEVTDKLGLADQAISKVRDTLATPGKATTQRATASAAVLASRASLQSQLFELNRQIETIGNQIATLKQAQSDKINLSTTMASLRERTKAEQARLGGDPAASWGTMINAPERMIVVDPPKDPELRTSSRLYFVFSGAFGGLLLGVALVILAEILDTTLRSADQMIASAGVPCLCSLPVLASTSGGGRRYPLGVAYQGTPRLSAPAGRLQERWSSRDG